MSADLSQADLVHLHKAWIGYVQPQGLVVTAAVLADAWIFPPRDLLDLQERFADFAKAGRRLPSFRAFAADFLDWTDDLAPFGEAVPADLTALVDGQALRPSFVVRDPETGAPALLGLSVDPAADLDARPVKGSRTFLSPHQTLERLLWETGASIGVVENGRAVRLVYAPRGENVGHATFEVDDMLSTAGRPVLGALLMLLSARRFEGGEPEKRLPALLQKSREYQSTVSAALREQVLDALGALLRGFEEADTRSGGALFTGMLDGKGLHDLYAGLVTVIMRLVFLLYAEEKGLLPLHDPLYAQGYSLRGVFDRLERDRDEHGATQKDRYGAWAHLVSLFRLLFDGVRAATGLTLPARRGDLFDPDRYPFLEGRRGVRLPLEPIEVPRVSDATVLEVLSSLALYRGERLLYGGLDVEHIGGVYEGLMGFDVLVTAGRSACLLPQHVVMDLDELAKAPGPERLRMLKAEAGIDLKDKAAAEVRGAEGAEGLFAALSRRISPRRPGLLPVETLVLQPGQERRRTGSHYTPRALTRPIVETALRPIWERLGAEVTPAQILDLKICDPAMGSGAFLVEACRQLAAKLTEAWRRTGEALNLPADEDALLHARRLVAQRCLYGVDKNPLAVDLARVSLWLETFASEHPFTFVDHALRCGDSLVGLSREQIAGFQFAADSQPALDRAIINPTVIKAENARTRAYVAHSKQVETIRVTIANRVEAALEKRVNLQSKGDVEDDAPLATLWRQAEEAVAPVRLIGDVLVSAYFESDSTKSRLRRRDDLVILVERWLAGDTRSYPELVGRADELRERPSLIPPFHWEIEFPEVFQGPTRGFDAIIGNPPFAGKNNIASGHATQYPSWLLFLHEQSHGNSDLVAHFFRRTFAMLRHAGTLGLIATNTIRQGDTRTTGLRWICTHGGAIYSARRRVRWPGIANVVVSVIHVTNTPINHALLDGIEVPQITAFLVSLGGSENPSELKRNADLAYIGTNVVGEGFKFDDTNKKNETFRIEDMRAVIAREPKAKERIFPFLGGEEITDHPAHAPHRYIIDFGDMTEDEARAWPELFALVESRVKPKRMKESRLAYQRYWWRHGERRVDLYKALPGLTSVLVTCQTGKYRTFARVSARMVFSTKAIIILCDSNSLLGLIQSSIHEAWAVLLGSSMKDDPVYTPSDCFETFPFPPPGDPRTLDTAHPALEPIGKRYYDFRAALMIRHDEGLTKTYNHFHDPGDNRSDIAELRALHAEMDRAVLDAYGWTDLRPTYDFRVQLDESTRYTWDDATRDEVLGRLLDLNRRYAAEETAAKEAAAKETASREAAAKQTAATEASANEPAASPSAPPARKKRGPKKGGPGGQTNLFG